MRHAIIVQAWLLLTVLSLGGCHGAGRAAASQDGGSGAAWPTGLRGHLLMIGGGLEDGNRAVYERFIALARENAGGKPPRVIIATASSADQDAGAKGKLATIREYCPECRIDVLKRETPTRESVELVTAAHAMFFTGGDQKRVTTRYLMTPGAGADPSASKELSPLKPRMVDTPEAAAMRELLQRGGVIAGTSAGEAMMSDPMFLTGRSTEALGIRVVRPAGAGRAPDEDPESKPLSEATPLGPQIGQGMGFVPRLICDSHFLERHRFGRLVAALEITGVRLGVGVGEDGCAEIDLATGELVGVSAADSVIVDVAGVQCEGLIHRNLRAMVLSQGKRVSVPRLLGAVVPGVAARPAETEEMAGKDVAQGGAGPAAGRFFRRGATGSAAAAMKLDGYEQVAWAAPGADGEAEWACVEILPLKP